MNDISVGCHVGRYEVKKELGEGGMGKVYCGYDPKLNRPVAIKTLSDDMAKDPDSVKRFLREARAAACLPDDSHIVKVYDINQLNGNGRPYIVMEYVEGKTFSSYIDRNVLPDSATVDWRLDKFRQILEAVNYAHKNGVVHRDLKPGNVMISDSGLAKVMDFGLALIDGSHTQTGKGNLGMGTPAYGAPEQFSGKSSTDERTDIYSLGVILYELLTGQLPFTGGVDPIYNVINTPAPSVRSCNPNISPALSDVVARCLEKDPNKRFHSVDELIKSFDKACVEQTESRPTDDITKSTVKELHPTTDGDITESIVVKPYIKPDQSWIKTDGTILESVMKKIAPTLTEDTLDTDPILTKPTIVKPTVKEPEPTPPAPVPQSNNSGLTGGLFGGLLGVFLAFILFYILFNPNKTNVTPPEPVATPSYSQSSNTYVAEPEPVVATPEPVVTPDPSQALRDIYANLRVGECFEFGTYPQGADGERKPIMLRILKRDSDSILVISELGLDCKRYNEEKKEITWADCTLRHWLNDDFYNRAFNSQEQSLIKTSNVTNNAGPSTNDRIFLLSVDEAERLFKDDKDRFCKPTDYAVKNGAYVNDGSYNIAYEENAWWWLRSRGDSNYSAAGVDSFGSFDISGSNVNSNCGVIRPAFKLAI